MKKYPDLVSKNKALCKAISLLPVTTKSSLPTAYVRYLPLAVGAVIAIAFLIFPTSYRQITFQTVETSFEKFSFKNQELKSYLTFSLRAGVSAYSDQIKKNINILPIDTKVEPQLYAGRVEIKKLSKLDNKINLTTLAEKTHLMTASVVNSLDNFK